MQKLTTLNNYLSRSEFTAFWSTLKSDDLYTDLTSEVNGFDELMRVRIAAIVSSSVRQMERTILEDWLELRGPAFEKFVEEVCGWKVESTGLVTVPVNKDNEAKGTVVRENVKFDQFARVVKRAYEQPA